MPSKTKNAPKKKNGNGRKPKGMANNAGTKGLQTRNLASALMQLNENRRPNTVSPSHLRGSDFITTIDTVASTGASGSILATFPISPSAYPGTRITSLSQLWERFRFTSLNLRYVPAVPMTIACQFIIYIDTDPLDDPSTITNKDAVIRQATAQARSQQFNFNKAKNIALCIRKDDQMYYTGADKQNLRFSSQGTVYVIQVTDVLDFNGATLETSLNAGSIYLDWNLCFDIPQINPSALQLSSWQSAPPATWPRSPIAASSVLYIPSTVSVEPNQAYIVSTDYTSLTYTGTAILALDITSSIAGQTTYVADSFDSNEYSTSARGLIVSGPDGSLNITAASQNTFDASSSTGICSLLFTPVSF
jgi:hypothetical protein